MNRGCETIRSAARPRAFTLVELMVAIALVLILLVGINQVFKMTTDTVGAGQAINAASRDLRGAQSVFFNDLHGAVTSNPPVFMIRSQQTPAFRNQADQLGDRDYNQTDTYANRIAQILSIDLDNDGTEGEVGVPGEIISPAIYNDRNHRTDMLMFFARGYYPRQTGNDGTFAANMSSNEAWIWYGHVKRPDFSSPAGSTNADALNPLQGYESRTPGELPDFSKVPPDRNDDNFHAANWILGRVVTLLRQPDGSDNIYDLYGNSQVYLKHWTSDPATVLSPLSINSVSSESAASDRYNVAWSRYDLAGTTIDDFRQRLVTAIDPPYNLTDWWNTRFSFRYQCNIIPARPLSSQSIARTVPAFLPSCSQFIVEYAGDFLTQENDPTNTNYGQVKSAGSDGKIDYFISNGVAQTRWYGLPRDINGDGVINLLDVVPLRDVRNSATTVPAPVYAPFERAIPTYAANYALVSGGVPAMPDGSQYIVAWGPDTAGEPMPRMIRIVATVDDPAGRMASGQTMEYVIDLP
ncbi:MAG: prepilin-type N-terminal cleavage/methylation domain-containing protein [Phycisphaerales bacterium]|jgi:prepilin-type N-terminal cleavage/methylation domain-containing protein|nr:prepilin-type N-terminal cleavage/methylation domain-containing protein [Phycisphaerales bacterium]